MREAAMNGYCSWCFRGSKHRPTQKNYLRRDVWQCSGCGHFTLRCRSPGCKHFAKGHSKEYAEGKRGSTIDRIKEGWHSEFCAEHDGSVASFERLGDQLEDLSDFRSLFGDRKLNLVKAATVTFAVVLGVVVIGGTMGAAAPEYAAALGSLGLLGSASTGTAIATLSGAALTSASLAVIGSGGVAFITAVGAALGGILGGVVSSRYVGEIQDFGVVKIQTGRNPSVVFVNGFLNQKNGDLDDWTAGAYRVFKHRAWYLTTWESKTLQSLGALLYGNLAQGGAMKFFTTLAKRATKKAGSKLNPATYAYLAADIIGNDWHSAMTKAAMTGIVLADLMARTPGKQYVLVGHSLGCRVIYFALEALSTRAEAPLVKDVILMGGAVGADNEAGWSRAEQAVSGRIYNCFSKRDLVLKAAYQGANAFLSMPIGMGPIAHVSRKIQNRDCSEFIGGHAEWKRKLDGVLSGIGYGPKSEQL
jgi:pimeloyl-ACP methyl ester carboxylesterase